MKVSDRLTDTAELVLEFALQTAWRELAAKYGTPRSGPPLTEAGFAVIGYGKLGGLELGYGSDLDLVFLHDSRGAQQETNGTPPLDNERFFGRLVQRLIHFLSIQTSSGRLYEVDTRLRPTRPGSGSIRHCCAAGLSRGRAAFATSSSGCAARCSSRT
jgi:glutamate-ammonia-ligase adenylyltransferase